MQHVWKVTMRGQDPLWTGKSWSQTVRLCFCVDFFFSIQSTGKDRKTHTLSDGRMLVLNFILNLYINC